MSLSVQWASLAEVLADVAPTTAATLLPPASPRVVAAVERATVPWPTDLHEFFSLQNGQRETPGGGSVLPTGALLAVEDIVGNRNLMIEVMGELVADDPEYYEGTYSDLVAAFDQAGTETDDHLFLPGYIPITKSDSNYTYCDVRHGDRRGCIDHRDKEGGHDSQPQWASLTDMVIGLRESLTTGVAIGWYTTRLTDGTLQWEIDL